MNGKKTTDKLAIAAAVGMILALLAVGVFAQGASTFHFFGPLSRVLTPNGDGRNDMAYFCFDNPSDSDASGKIYGLLGAEVSAMGPRQIVSGSGPYTPSCPAPLNGIGAPVQYLTWDGRSNGATVHSGIYVYRITAETKVYSGTLIVVR